MSEETRNRYFDELASGLASGSISRGRALRLMGAALVGGTLASLGIGEAAADPPGCKRNGKNCTKDKVCCSGICTEGHCACPSGYTQLSNGTCVKRCTSDTECAGCGGCLFEVSSSLKSCGTVGSGTLCSSHNDCTTPGEFCNGNILGQGVCARAC